MATNGSSTYNSTSGFIDISLSDSTVTNVLDDYIWYSGSTVTSERYSSDTDFILGFENKNLRIPMKVLRGVKPKIKLFGSKPSKNAMNIKQFTGHSFRVGSSKK